MAFSPLSSPKKTSAYSPSKLKPKALEFKNKTTYLCKKPTKHVCKAKKVTFCSSLPKDEEENTLALVKCDEQKVIATSQSSSFVDKDSLAMKRAHEVQENLEQEFPSFVKLMLRSHVTGGFWLGLPRPFCVKNLPKHDETVVLVGENGEDYITKYLATKNGLSGGWRGFSIAHNLLEGDVLVFQLIDEWKFKVFIVRASSLAEIDGAISLLNLHVDVKPIVSVVEEESICEALMQENVESPVASSEQAYSQENCPSDQFGSENHENSGSDILDEIEYLESVVDFKDVKRFEAFKILVDGLSIDSEVDEHTRRKYYELCCSQQCYLHDRLIAGLNFKLVAGIISETVNVADAIRAAKVITPLGHLETWDKTLKSFEDLGMAVGFLLERLKKLQNISHGQKKKLETKTLERTSLEDERTRLKLRLLDIEREMRSLDDEIEDLKVEDKNSELTFKEAASAPW